MTFAEEIHRLQMAECGRADFAAIGVVTAIADQIDAELTLGAFGRDIDFTRRNVETLGIEF